MDKEKIIAEAKAANACIEGIEAFRKWEGDNDSFMQKHSGYGWWAVGNCPSFEVSEAVLDKCAEAEPRLALRFAAERLTPERLDKCTEAEPRFALEYAAERLTPERLDKYAEAEPWFALMYAAEHLTPERLDKCAEADPVFALKHAARLLNPERLDKCAEAEPWFASIYAAERLPTERKTGRECGQAGRGDRASRRTTQLQLSLLTVAVLAAVAIRLGLAILFVPLTVITVLLAGAALHEDLK